MQKGEYDQFAKSDSIHTVFLTDDSSMCIFLDPFSKHNFLYEWVWLGFLFFNFGSVFEAT